MNSGTNEQVVDGGLHQLEDFLHSATLGFDAHTSMRRFLLPHGELVSCVLWNGSFFITGTDIVRAAMFRFEQSGRVVDAQKKFEEGVFSDLRNVKTGTGAVLEEPRSQLLRFLHERGCLRTLKKQKVFAWAAIDHDKLLADAIERDRKRLANTDSWGALKINIGPLSPQITSPNDQYPSPDLEVCERTAFGKSFPCTQCTRTFKRNDQLRKHIRSHMMPSPIDRSTVHSSMFNELIFEANPLAPTTTPSSPRNSYTSYSSPRMTSSSPSMHMQASSPLFNTFTNQVFDSEYSVSQINEMSTSSTFTPNSFNAQPINTLTQYSPDTCHYTSPDIGMSNMYTPPTMDANTGMGMGLFGNDANTLFKQPQRSYTPDFDTLLTAPTAKSSMSRFEAKNGLPVRPQSAGNLVFHNYEPNTNTANLSMKMGGVFGGGMSMAAEKANQMNMAFNETQAMFLGDLMSGFGDGNDVFGGVVNNGNNACTGAEYQMRLMEMEMNSSGIVGSGFGV